MLLQWVGWPTALLIQTKSQIQVTLPECTIPSTEYNLCIWNPLCAVKSKWAEADQIKENRIEKFGGEKHIEKLGGEKTVERNCIAQWGKAHWKVWWRKAQWKFGGEKHNEKLGGEKCIQLLTPQSAIKGVNNWEKLLHHRKWQKIKIQMKTLKQDSRTPKT